MSGQIIETELVNYNDRPKQFGQAIRVKCNGSNYSLIVYSSTTNCGLLTIEGMQGIPNNDKAIKAVLDRILQIYGSRNIFIHITNASMRDIICTIYKDRLHYCMIVPTSTGSSEQYHILLNNKQTGNKLARTQLQPYHKGVEKANIINKVKLAFGEANKKRKRADMVQEFNTLIEQV